MKEELKPCPFCNGVPEIIGTETRGRIWIQCNCGVSTRLYETKQQAVDAWNYRQREDTLTKKIQSMELDLAHFPANEYRLACEELQKEYSRYFNSFVKVKECLETARDAVHPFLFNVDNKDIEYIFDIVDKTLRGEK